MNDKIIIKKKVRRPYVKNSDILIEMDKYNKNNRVISDELAEMIVKIAENYSSIGSFAGYTWREDMVSEAVLTCVKYMHNFDSDKSKNPFSYFTSICRNAFINYIRKQNRHSDIKDICFKKKRILEDDTVYLIKAINYEKLID